MSFFIEQAWRLIPGNWRGHIFFCSTLEKLPYREACIVRSWGSCWQWHGWNSGNGYGKMRVAGRCCMAHRAIYELCIGPIEPPKVILDHLCRNRGCVNPFHLEPVLPKENIERGHGKFNQFASTLSYL